MRQYKYLVRKVGFVSVLTVIVVVAMSWTAVKIKVEDMIRPPPLQPDNITRIEKLTEECWDILDFRHGDQEPSILYITIVEICKPDSLRFPRVLAEVQHWFDLEYQGEQFFITEWIEKEGRKYIVASSIVCLGLEVSSLGLEEATCQTVSVRDMVKQSVWRRWWVEEWNADFRS